MAHYTLVKTPPSIEAYRRLRKLSGLSPKSLAAAEAGLPNTWYGVHMTSCDEVVGMGRIVGDGGCHFQIVDIAVLPEHQRRGLGKEIMTALMTYLDAHAPESAYVSLIADGPAKDLYAMFGFQATAPVSIGMWRPQR